MSAQFPGGFPGGGNSSPFALKADVERVQRELREMLNQNAGGLRRALGERAAQIDEQLKNLATVASALSVQRAGGAGAPESAPGVHERDRWRVGHGVVRIEDIPGRRIPYVMSMDLYIGAGATSDIEQSLTISQEGPFIAVRRMATFRSAYSYVYTNPQSQATSRFSGRSNGRFRPTSSAWDLNDGGNNAMVTTPNPLVANALSGAAAITSSMAAFRSMELDALIQVIVQGASYPRQNYPVPSSFWSTAINAPVDLGALDFFERGEQITCRVTPTHPNNPEYGNATGDAIFGAGNGWPFSKGQFDPHEGIVTPSAITDGAAPETISSDPIVRYPDGILTLAWEGYKIIQPTGPVG